jgi:hypothetical protein
LSFLAQIKIPDSNDDAFSNEMNTNAHRMTKYNCAHSERTMKLACYEVRYRLKVPRNDLRRY